MGSSESRLYKPPTLKKQSWRQGHARRAVGRPQHGRFRVLVNNLTNEQLEEYLLSFHSLGEFQRYLEFFQWREREDCIVNTRYLNYELGKDFCNTSYTARVYVERIPVRLSDIEDIPFPENLYLLLSALDGFEKLYRSVGYFRPSEDLICMDRDGRVKAWLHPDLSRCLPSGCAPEETGLHREEALESRMVEEIVRMVQQNTAHDGEPTVAVSDYLRRNQRGRGYTFKQARLEVLAYAEEFHADIPNYFESVVGIFDEQPSQNEEQSTSHPPFLKNDKDSEQNEGYHHQAIQNWQSQHPHVQVQERTTENANHYQPRERAYAQLPPPSSQHDHRPNSAVYSVNHHMPEQIYASSPYPANNIDYRSAPSPTSNHGNPSFPIKFNYQPQTQPQPQQQPQPQPQQQPSQPQAQLQSLPLPPPPYLPHRLQQPFINPHTPISQLVTPNTLVIRKVTSVPDETDRTHPEDKFDAKLVLSSSLKNLLVNKNRLVYSDSTSTYELDEELAQDMVKYLAADP